MFLYYITDRTQFPGGEQQRRELLIARVAEVARIGVDYIQLREKDLPARELEEIARDIVRKARKTGNATRVLINSRVDVAMATGADGVHLRSNDISPADVRRIWKTAGLMSTPVVAVSCHQKQEVIAAKFAGADFVVFGPVFEKSGMPGVGLSALRSACSQGIPVFALGGVSVEKAALCVGVGAAGIAGIRVFQDGDLNATLAKVRRHGDI